MGIIQLKANLLYFFKFIYFNVVLLKGTHSSGLTSTDEEEYTGVHSSKLGLNGDYYNISVVDDPETPRIASTDSPRIAATDSPRIVSTDSPRIASTDSSRIVDTSSSEVVDNSSPIIALENSPRTVDTSSPEIVLKSSPMIAFTSSPMIAFPSHTKLGDTMSPKLAYTSSPKIAGFSKTIALSEDLVIGNLSKNELRNGDLSLGGMEGRPTGLVWELNSEEEPEGGKKKESLSEEVVAKNVEKLMNIPSPGRAFEPCKNKGWVY